MAVEERMTVPRPLLRLSLAVLCLAGCGSEAGASDEGMGLPDDPGGEILAPEPRLSDAPVFRSSSAAPIGSVPRQGADLAVLPTDMLGSVSAPSAPTTLDSVALASGVADGGTALTLHGVFPSGTYSVTVGGVPCTGVKKVSPWTLACVTGNRGPHEEDADVVVTAAAATSVSLRGAFHYFCPWTWGPHAVRSCGAAPAAPVAPEVISATISTFQPGHGFVGSGAGIENLNDTSDFVGGTQSAFVRTDGSGGVKHLAKRLSSPIDFTGKLPKVWLKVDNVAKATFVELHLGSSATDYFRFRIVIPQGQNWVTEGEWLSLSLPFGALTVGHPNRAAVTNVELIALDDATGPVTVHLNGIAVVDEPLAKYPKGVVSFTFDDGYESQSSLAAPILRDAGFAGTAYLIAELVGMNGRLTTLEARSLQDNLGWEMAAHSYLASVHSVGFNNVPLADLEKDIVSVRSWLMTNGLNGYDDCAYPHGYFTGATPVLPLVRKYFSSCRTIFSTSVESASPSDAAKLRIFLITSTMPVATVNARIDEAVANHEWLILLNHNLVANTTTKSTNDWWVSEFASVVAHVKDSHIAVKTVSQVLRD